MSFALILAFVATLASGQQFKGPTDGYFGKEVGPLKSFLHGVKGTIYAIDSKRIGVRNFYYDGTAPAAFFWIGLKGRHGNEPDKNGIAIPDENGSLIVLKKYEGASFILTLPRNVTVDQLRWLSVWCQEFLLNFGHVNFPADLSVPTQVELGHFHPVGGERNQVSSGHSFIIDHKTTHIRNFTFDGKVPDVFFVAGDGSNPNDSKLLIKVPRIDGGLNQLPKFTGNDVTLRFPGPTSVFLFRFFAVYSNETALTFAQLNITDKPNVPPFTEYPVVKLP